MRRSIFGVIALVVTGLSIPAAQAFRSGRGSVVDAYSYEMVAVRAGEFLMGSPAGEAGRESDETQHEVRLTARFEIGATEVTQVLYDEIVGDNPSRYEGREQPVEQVSWCDAVAFCNRLSRREDLAEAYELPRGFGSGMDRDACNARAGDVGLVADSPGYRLPTEAQWEYAARAGTTDRFSWGDSPAEAVVKLYAWYDRNAEDTYWTEPHAKSEGAQQVAKLGANAWGLHDTAGNVWEWCWDRHGDHPSSAVTDPTGPDRGADRVLRGGSWYSASDSLRAAHRRGAEPGHSNSRVGFRVVRTVPGTAR